MSKPQQPDLPSYFLTVHKMVRKAVYKADCTGRYLLAAVDFKEMVPKLVELAVSKANYMDTSIINCMLRYI